MEALVESSIYEGGFKQLFNKYAKLTPQPRRTTFDHIAKSSKRMNMQEFFHFAKDHDLSQAYSHEDLKQAIGGT